MIFEAEDAVTWFEKMHQKTKEQIEYLTELDKKIGDGDHGRNMAQGFQSVVTNLQHVDVIRNKSVANILKLSAISLMNSVGGSASILYATAFLRMATVFQEEPKVDAIVFEKALRRAVEGIQTRGNVSFGEKTLVDVWIAVADLFSETDQFPKPNQIDRVAHNAMESTKQMVAKKGKAHFYEEKSIGHIDPGAASSYYLFQSLAETFEEKMNE